MHCVSSYPASEKTLNLNCLDLLKNLAHKIGFSDHTLGNLASIVAVSKGAKFIEKHFTLDKKMKGPDHFFSLNPKELKKYIKNIRLAEKALGAKEKKCQPEEKEVKKISVKSIVASKNLDRGKKITYKNISLKRPGIGMSGFEIKKIIGKKTRRKILKDEIIRFDDFKID